MKNGAKHGPAQPKAVAIGDQRRAAVLGNLFVLGLVAIALAMMLPTSG